MWKALAAGARGPNHCRQPVQLHDELMHRFLSIHLSVCLGLWNTSTVQNYVVNQVLPYTTVKGYIL